MGAAVAHDQLEAVDGEPARGGELLDARELAVARAEAILGLQRRRVQDGDAVLAARAVGDEDLVVGDSESLRPRDLEQRLGGEQCAVVLAQP